jgi:pimeloyl-ACP methyl ester carboxylesterase
MIRRIYPTRFGQLHLRSNEGKGVPLVLLHMSPRSGAMWETLQELLERPTHAPDRLGYGYSDAPPWALSLEQYAQSTVDGLKAAGMQGQIDLLGIHTGSIEAIEIANQLGSQVRRLALVGMPLFTAEEQQRQMEKYSEQPLRPATEGGHVLGAWRGGYAVEKKIKSVKSAVIVFAPHDEIIEQTARVKPLLGTGSTYIDLPDVGMDAFSAALERMVTLLNRHLPP